MSLRKYLARVRNALLGRKPAPPPPRRKKPKPKAPPPAPPGMRLDEIVLENGNQIIGRPEQFERSTLRFHGQDSRVIFHEGAICTNLRLDLHHRATVEIHPGALVRGGLLAHHGCTITIGARTRCNGEIYIRAAEGTRVTLGEDCLIARATLRSSDMHPVFDQASGARLNPGKDITIGDRVWLAQDVFVTKGVTVGADSVLAACAVITKDVPAGSIAAGNPARVVRSGIRWEGRLPVEDF